ncbi:unnamed protein product [Ectocarpus sp. 12 AP-2014]
MGQRVLANIQSSPKAKRFYIAISGDRDDIHLAPTTFRDVCMCLCACTFRPHCAVASNLRA